MNILFLCTGNSCRSQMAEALAKSKFKNHKDITFYSAGTQKHGMNERAVKAIEELGISMKGHYSKVLNELDDIQFDRVYTVCSHANESCPIFNGNAKIIHKGFDDPPGLTKEMDAEAAFDIYRRVRDEIYAFIDELEKELN